MAVFFSVLLTYTKLTHNVFDVCQRTTTYASVLLTYTKLTHNVFDVCQLGSANFSYVGIR